MQKYDDLGYGRLKVGFGKRLAVAVVDFQKGLIDPAFPFGGSEAIAAAAARTIELLRAARLSEVPVIHAFLHFPHSATYPLWKVTGLVEAFRPGDPSTGIDERLLEPGHDHVVGKVAPSLFFDTPARQILADEGVDTLVVTGCATSGCVRATIVDAFSYGLRVVVPRECVGDFDRQAHEDSLRDVGLRYADVVSLAEVLGYFAPKAATPLRHNLKKT